MISDLIYSTVICYKACKFPVIYLHIGFVCASELSFLLCDLTNSTVICYTGGILVDLVSCMLFLSYHSFFMNIFHSDLL